MTVSCELACCGPPELRAGAGAGGLRADTRSREGGTRDLVDHVTTQLTRLGL